MSKESQKENVENNSLQMYKECDTDKFQQDIHQPKRLSQSEAARGHPFSIISPPLEAGQYSLIAV